MNRALAVAVTLLSTLVFGQGAPPAGGGISANCSSCDLVDKTLTLSGAFSTGAGTFTSTVADGASAVAFNLSSSTSYVTGGAKLFQINNNATHYFDVDVSGNAHILVGNLSLNTDSAIVTTNRLQTTTVEGYGGSPLTIGGNPGDGASAVAVAIKSNNAYTTSGAELLSIQNAGVEKAFVDKDGAFTSNAGGSLAGITLTNHPKLCLIAGCSEYMKSDGFGSLYLVGNTVVLQGAVSVTGAITSGTFTTNTLAINGSAAASPTTITALGGDTDIGISLVTKGAGGVLVPGIVVSASARGGTSTFSAATTKTVTVVSGCKPICTNNTSTAAIKCAVSSTTLTATEAGSSSDSFTYLCI
jgi:hypothetical protein